MKWTRETCLLLLALCGPSALADGGDQLQSFKQEFVVPVVALIPPELAESVAAREVEIRQQIRYDAPGKHLDVITFPVMTNAPAFTPNEALPCDPLEQFRVDLKAATVTGNTITLTGAVAQHPKVLLSAVREGGNYSLTSAFKTATSGESTAFQNVIITAEDTRRFAYAAGTMAVAAAAPVPPAVLVTSDFITSQPEAQIDAAGSEDPDSSQPLEFYWRTDMGPAVVRGCRTPNPTVQFSGGPGAYRFIVSVTNAAGASTEAAVIITYYGRF